MTGKDWKGIRIVDDESGGHCTPREERSDEVEYENEAFTTLALQARLPWERASDAEAFIEEHGLEKEFKLWLIEAYRQ